MQKTEKLNGENSFNAFLNQNLRSVDDFDQFDNDCMTMSIYENLIEISEQCPIALNNALTQSFALLQEKYPTVNYIKTLATFTKMLLILSTYDDFIHKEYEKFSNTYNAYLEFQSAKNGR